ncbi:hypothetical protein [Holdemania massiliensis]|uniref:YfhO family protein n=1 Tax=Holdemania massiliensis TaxID=1468449 RepID=A0A6N7S7T0_9FIRM|nr:hypothetical protein [Holdemania massiliensis]MSA71728.1 hypothetical protein [Holdemania massiliensis]MSA89943.1 hypothetical protein [Holdemania massiliensis]MSB78703.1 hypothetical protein [Holdemania massiliensis]MSC33698.1 hypothetical protein [Holdemania massiliensis]MSC40089.1 hypothetical protein [Holdemania massiliensis]
MKYLAGSLYPVLLVLIAVVLWNNTAIRSTIKKNKKSILVFLFLNFVIINILLFFHLRQEQFIAYWDFGGFWRKSVEFNQMMNRSVKEAMDNLWFSLNYSEYSFLPEWFLYFPTQLLGNTYPRFILAMFNSFILPANLILYIFSLMIIEKNKLTVKKVFLGMLIATFAGNLYSMVFGYIGSAGLPFITSILLLVYADGLEKFSWRNNIFIGLSMIILLLVRRWFAYWIVGFYVAYTLAYLIREGIDHALTKEKIKVQFLNMLVCGLIPLTILLTLFFPLFRTITTYNYAEAYSVAKVGGAAYIIGWFIQFYGWLLVLLLIPGVVYGIKSKKHRLITILCIIQTLVAIILFNRVQSFGSHHYYIINGPVMILMMIGLEKIVDSLSAKTGMVLLVSSACLVCVNFSKTVLFGKNQKADQTLDKLNVLISAPFPDLRIRSDLDKIRNMADFLDKTPGEYEYVYVLSNSVLFNDDMLRNAFFPEKNEGVANLLVADAYDYRDGIPEDFFQYYYIVVADPIQLQFGEENQKCVSILAEFMLNSEESDPYYRIVREYDLDNDVHVNIYQRIEQVPNSVRKIISERYREFYPKNPELYEFSLLPE